MKLNLEKLIGLQSLPFDLIIRAEVNSPLIQFGWTLDDLSDDALKHVESIHADLEVGWRGWTCHGAKNEIAQALETLNLPPWHLMGAGTVCFSPRLFTDFTKFDLSEVSMDDRNHLINFVYSRLFREQLKFHQPVMVDVHQAMNIKSDANGAAGMLVCTFITPCTKEVWEQSLGFSTLAKAAGEIFADYIKQQELKTGQPAVDGKTTLH